MKERRLKRPPDSAWEAMLSSQYAIQQVRTSSHLATPRAIAGSLPVNIRVSDENVSLAPSALFSPPYLQRTAVELQEEAARENGGSLLPGLRTQRSAHSAAGEDGQNEQQKFLQQVSGMLVGSGADRDQSLVRPSAVDAFYDFDEYIFLRNPEDPYSPGINAGPGQRLPIPADPRFQHFADAAANGIAEFVDFAWRQAGNATGISPVGTALHQVLRTWWFDLCSVRAFNRLSRYSRTALKNTEKLTPEKFYGYNLGMLLSSTALPQALSYLASGNSDNLGKLLTVAYWEEVLTGVFDQYFDAAWLIDPSAPQGEYPFDLFPTDEVMFGLQVIHRQAWRLLGYARGDLVKSIPLGPRESQKVSVKITRRTKLARSSETASSQETTSESSNTTKDSAEVVAEATEKLNKHADAEVSGGYGPFVQAKVSGGLAQDIGSSSKQTNSRLNEIVDKTASRIKRDTRVTVSTESEEAFEINRSSELTNPNDEIAVTYLYHRLQQQFWVSTQVAETHSVVFVPEPLPEWNDVNEDWLREHGDIIADALLDSSYGPILAAIRKEPPNLAYSPGTLFEKSANAGVQSVQDYRTFSGGYMPDMLSAGQQYYEQDFVRRNNLAMEQARRRYQSEAILTHVRRNILHYMRAIWLSEDYDQRMQRYNRIRVPTAWVFVPRTPLASTAGSDIPLDVEGVFMPLSGSARPLTEVIDPVGPIGFLFNCAIYRMRDDVRLANLNQALAYLRAAYMRFDVTVEFSSNAQVSLRQAVAYSPRSFASDYTLTYRTQRKKWLIPVPNQSEMDWIEVKQMPDGSLDAMGLRLWLDGTPIDQASMTVRVRSSNMLEDPHLRLVRLQNPLPDAAAEPHVFNDVLLDEMAGMFPGSSFAYQQNLTWADLDESERNWFRGHYHRFIMLRESGRLVTLDTANVVLDLESSLTPALEQFKRLHRYVDVLKEYQELHRRTLENTRRERLIQNGMLGDPDIERVTLVGARSELEDVIALTESMGGEREDSTNGTT
jgi:hypothetical protein